MDRKTIIEKLRIYKNESDFSDKIKELGLFGSYAIGNEATKSDIDIFVRLKPARMFDLISIKMDLEKLLGKKVDIIALRQSMNEYLRKEIKKHGIYV